MHIVSCAKTAEPIEMQFGILGRGVQGTCITRGCRCLHQNWHFGGVWL